VRTNLSSSKKDLEANTSINPLNNSPDLNDSKRSKKPLQFVSSLKFDQSDEGSCSFDQDLQIPNTPTTPKLKQSPDNLKLNMFTLSFNNKDLEEKWNYNRIQSKKNIMILGYCYSSILNLATIFSRGLNLQTYAFIFFQVVDLLFIYKAFYQDSA
jgi:hypothetical protein